MNLKDKNMNQMMMNKWIINPNRTSQRPKGSKYSRKVGPWQLKLK